MRSLIREPKSKSELNVFVFINYIRPTFSSFDGIRPHVIAQSYNFPALITGLGVTRTQEGITMREILVSLNGRSVLGVSKWFLDPRRPASPSSDDKEEGLIQYNPIIDVNFKEIASYSRELIGCDFIGSTSTELESTSLVLAYGVDLFFTRRMPSKEFDVLSENFGRKSLLLTIFGLFVSIHFAKGMAERKRVSQRWK